MKKDELSLYRPGSKWEEVLSVEERQRPIVTLLQWTGIESYVPVALWNRLLHPNPTAHLYIVH
jgi:hypothetical protein